MKRGLPFILILIAAFLISGWLGLNLQKTLTENQRLKKQIDSLREQKKAAKTTANFLPSNQAKEIYTFAQENQGLLKKLDCYCGCQNPMHQPYHKSLANCFVKEITNEGRIIYDSHGENCKTCIDEALDVKKWLGGAKNYQTIKDLIDNKYKPAMSH